MEDYKCSVCGGTFEKMRSDDEALQETKELFGDFPMEELAIVCDVCFKAMGLPETLTPQ
jgi:DNA-directed RNA polymerase subunit RPC12/RpoP